MAEGIELTKDEQIAREFFIFIFTKGSKAPCNLPPTDYGLPPWFDPEKFRRGQRYFHDNRIPILFSNFTGLISLLAEPKGLRTLIATGQTGTPETARKRYMATLEYTLTWYETDLTPGSKSFEMLKKVRYMHYFASCAVKEKGIGYLNQAEISLTAFGFMGFALVRPHVLSIRHDNREDREAFVYFWAVICYMLGVEDRFNMCLQPFDVLFIFCQMIIRYALIPIVQIELSGFKEMALAIVDGIKKYIPTLDYESQLFQARRLIEVPGYQYKVDNCKEVLCRSILSQDDLNFCTQVLWEVGDTEHILMTEDIPLIEVVKEPCKWPLENTTKRLGSDVVINDKHEIVNREVLHKLRNSMGLDDSQYIVIRFIQYEREWFSCLNDSKFKKMNRESQRLCRWNHMWLPIYRYKIGRYVMESILTYAFRWIRIKDNSV